jgi:hypothetical protein
MRVLVGCERSRVVAQAFEARGHKVLSCDLEPPRRGGAHYQGDVFDVIDYPWDLAIFHPPCTHTAVSGAKHFADKWADGRQACGVSFIMALVRRSMHVPRVAIEQPVSVLSSLWRKPDQVIQPWMFGHGETKATCLWLRGLPLLQPTQVVEGREARIHRMAPSEDRAEKRSETFAGIAEAMARQWAGDLLEAAA